MSHKIIIILIIIYLDKVHLLLIQSQVVLIKKNILLKETAYSNNHYTINSPSENEINIEKLTSSYFTPASTSQNETKATHMKNNTNYSLPNISKKM